MNPNYKLKETYAGKFLEAGVAALANTTLKFNYPWFFAHSGATVLAGYFLLQSNRLSDNVKLAIVRHLDKFIDGDPELFAPFEDEKEQYPTDDFVATLTKCTLTHSTTGHGVIFGTLALKAITHAPGLFTESVSKGLILLLRDCLNDVPNRHLGIPNYASCNIEFDGMRMFDSPREAADYSLTVHETVYPDQAIEEAYYFLAGDLLHCVTFAHALLQLDELGFGDMASAGLDAFAQHLQLSTRKHPQLQPFLTSTVFNPEEEKFWERPLDEPHHLKLAYSAIDIAQCYSAAERADVYRALSKYWAMYS